MNQILSSNENGNLPSSPSSHKNHSRFFKFQFVFCLIGAILSCGYYVYLQYDKNKHEALSYEILNRTNITSLYENTESNYSGTRVVNDHIYEQMELVFPLLVLLKLK